MSLLNLKLEQQQVFAEDVLQIFKTRQITFHGCPPWYLEINPGGDMKMWFYGTRDRKPWRGGITIQHQPNLNYAVLSGDCEALVQAFEQIINKVESEMQ